MSNPTRVSDDAIKKLEIQLDSVVHVNHGPWYSEVFLRSIVPVVKDLLTERQRMREDLERVCDMAVLQNLDEEDIQCWNEVKQRWGL